ncbi:MAG TPA: hypothetical protein VKF36_13835 [Syntrophorhabdales bacterium]|nr:hypothetical protein [Syntrophorhabdales bacterium]
MKTDPTRTLLTITALVLVLSLSGFSALAQDRPPDHLRFVRDQVGADKKTLVKEAMDLTESEAKAFWPVYEKYQKDLDKPTNRTMNLIKEYAEKYQSMTNDVARQLTDEFLAIEAERQKLRETYLPQFRKVLPDIKVGRYYQLENQVSTLMNFELAANIPLMK